MQNHTDSGTPCFSTQKQTWTFCLNNIAIKVAKCTKYEIKAYNFFSFLVCSQYFKFSFNYMNLQVEIDVIKCRNQNMAVLLNKSMQLQKNMGYKLIIWGMFLLF